jgi:hypothetical protein
LLRQEDPYLQGNRLAEYEKDRSIRPDETAWTRQEGTRFVYPPTLLLFIAPLALLPYKLARIIWYAGSTLLFIAASFLAWKAGSKINPTFGGVMAFLYLIGSSSMLCTANPAASALSLCIIGGYCIVRNEFAFLGTIALACSLAIKPHDSGIVWLYFLLAGGKYRLRSLHAFAIALLLGVISISWVAKSSPHWSGELKSDLRIETATGGTNDPGPTGPSSRIIGTIICLQRIFSLICNEPSFYNSCSYLIGGILLAIWAKSVLNSKPTVENAWVALSTGAFLTLLPIYHRLNDSKLALISIPACCMFWMSGDRSRKTAAWAILIACILTMDLSRFLILSFAMSSGQSSYAPALSKIEAVCASIMTPLALFLAAVITLKACVSVSRTSNEYAPDVPGTRDC